MPDDPISEVWRILAPVIGYARADVELLRLRAKWGGTWLYVRKPPGDVTRADRERPKRGPNDP